MPMCQWNKRGVALIRVAATLLCAVSGCLIGAAEPESDSTWRSFQNGGQLSLTSDDLPVQWNADAGVRWTAECDGYGQSTPLIAHGLVVVTSTSGPQKNSYHLTALEASTGVQRWKLDFPNPTPRENSSYVSRAAPTGVADVDGFIAFFEGGLLAAVTPAGQLRWKRDLTEDYGPISTRHGLAASLEQNDDDVFVWVERDESPYVASINKKTGETSWKKEGLGVTSWASPRIIPTRWGTQLVCSGSGLIAAYDPATGKRLWEFSDIAGNTTCTPVPVGEGEFLIGASEGRGGSGGGQASQSNGLMRIGKSAEERFFAEFAWRCQEATSSFGSPVATDDHAFFVSRAGVLFSVDRQSGQPLAKQRIESGSIWATPLIANNRLYLFGYKGTTSVVELDEQIDGVAANSLGTSGDVEASASSPAAVAERLYAASASDGQLVLRYGSRLYAIGR